MPERIIIATRESRLALWQAEHVRDLLAQRFGMAVDLLRMTTTGDRIVDRTLAKAGGKGLFVQELAARLRAGCETTQMLPCAGRGARGLETRPDASGLIARVAARTHWPTALAVHAERAVSRELGGSCSMPLAAHATLVGEELSLDA